MSRETMIEDHKDWLISRSEKLLIQAKDAFEFIDLALQYEDQNNILRSGIRMAEVRAKAHVLFTEIKRFEGK